MANLKEVRGRITSVKSTQQITKAMKMVSAAKLRRAQDNILKIRPYSEKLNQILSNVTSTLEGEVENPYSVERAPEKILIIAVTSDRGLAGPFNANIGKGVIKLVKEQYAKQYDAGNVTILTIGKKGRDFLKRREYDTDEKYMDLFSDLNFDEARKAAEYVMELFSTEEYDKVELVYNRFKNVATQIVTVEQFLPVEETEEEEEDTGVNTEYIFEPGKVEIVRELIPKTLKIQFYKALLESIASEHGARMTAMDQATDNAQELIKQLQLTYNRTRQAAITKEILEIVGGAEALAK